MGHVFILYSTHNSEYAHTLPEKLRTEGFDVWIASASLRSSDNWWQLIIMALQDCVALIVVMTPESQESEWVQHEGLLLDERKKPIFPILLAEANWSFFVDTHYVGVGQSEVTSSLYSGRLPSKYPSRIWRNIYPTSRWGERT